MNSSNAHRSDQGFTLIESLIIVAVIGILAAVAAPSFLATLNRSRVNDALTSVEGALKEAQKEATKRSTSCTVTLDTTDKKVTGPCLVTGDRVLTNNVLIKTSMAGTAPTITFSYKGTVTLSDTGTIALYRSNESNNQRCLVLSSPLGIIRSGNYTGSVSGSITATNCSTSL